MVGNWQGEKKKEKEWIKKEIKSVLIGYFQIKRSGLNVSNFKVSSSVELNCLSRKLKGEGI